MKHFVGYHNFERMEQEAEEAALKAGENEMEEFGDEESPSEEDGKGYPYGFVTRKKPDRFIGNVIWGIQGQGRPRDYFLFDWFIVEIAEQVDRERFTHCLRGSRGASFSDGIYLNEEPWFPEFRAVNSNFSLGLQEIAARFLDEICKLAKREAFPLPADCEGRFLDIPSHEDGGQSRRREESETSATEASSTSPPVPEAEQSLTERRLITEERIIRDTAITLEVKRLHDFCCQVCGKRLETPDGPYAEGAHIRPLGSPHLGPDNLENVLCLCPDHHVLFDRLAFSIDSDLRLIGIEGKLRIEQGHSISEAHLRHHRERFRFRPS